MKPDQFLSTSSQRLPEAAIVASLALGQLPSPSNALILENFDNGLPTFLITQPGLTHQSLEQFQVTPHRAEIHVALHTAADLHVYVLAQTERTADSELAAHHPVIFADRKTQSIVAYLDYHHRDTYRWLNHTAKVQYEKGHQFKRWEEMNNKRLTQENFALFLDEVINDFHTPTGAEVMSFAENLEFTSSQTFKSATRLATGETTLVFTDAREGDKSTKIIDEFIIGIPIWQDGQKVQIRARLFHRPVDVKDSAGAPTGAKQLHFWFTLRHLEEIKDQLFADEVTFLKTAFNEIAPVYSGLPPADPTTIGIIG
jgi:uncharacterized protein YfdQ (DUF2303 family)